MRNFDLYVSGILYGRLRLGDGTPQIQKLDVHTGALLDWQDLTEMGWSVTDTAQGPKIAKL